MEKIKLRSVALENYVSCANCMNEHFQSKEPFVLPLALETFLAESDEVLNIVLFPRVEAMVPESGYEHYQAFGFDLAVEPKSIEQLAGLIKTEELNRKTVRSLRGYYHKVYEKTPRSFGDVIQGFESDEDICHEVLALHYDVRYHPDKNVLESHDFYSGKLKGRGLMTRFFQRLSDVIDFDDLSSILFGQIVEKHTVNMFNPLRKKIPHDAYLCELLERKYVKSPFMRLFHRVGFQDMEIRTYSGFIGDLLGRKSETLHFRISEQRDDNPWREWGFIR